jgi:NAD-dependent epimerase/dehydratase family protein
MSTKNVVLIAGVHGVSGRAAAEDWSSLPGTQVYGLSRRSAPLPAGVEFISADLLDRDGLQRKLGKIAGITHIVFDVGDVENLVLGRLGLAGPRSRLGENLCRRDLIQNPIALLRARKPQRQAEFL